LRIGIEAKGSFDENCFLWDCDDARSDCFFGDGRAINSVSIYGARVELQYLRKTEDERAFAAGSGLVKAWPGTAEVDSPSCPSADSNLFSLRNGY
jgi:hypothetical protein